MKKEGKSGMGGQGGRRIFGQFELVSNEVPCLVSERDWSRPLESEPLQSR